MRLLADLLQRIGRFEPDDLPRAVDALQSNVRQAFERLGSDSPILRANEVTMALTAGQTQTVNHGLGVTPNRYLVTHLDAALTHYASAYTDTKITLTVAGTGSSSARVLVWRA